jgi:polysaccharide biosynthesis protein PslG
VRSGGARTTFRACQAVLLLTVALVLAMGSRPATAAAHTPGTTPEFFGVNGAYLRDYVQPAKAATLDGLAASMGAEGIDWARLTFDQAVEERTEGAFNWFVPDTMVAALARHGVRGSGSFIGTAYWAADPALNGAYGPRAWPYDIEGWSEWVAASARRFGSNGTFWAQHPELPYLPIKRWEIGNESNMGIFWRPAANPEQYASVYSASARAITAVDPEAEVIVAGLAPIFGAGTGGDLDVATFLKRLTAADPSLRNSIPAVAIHPYASTPKGARVRVAQFRRAMRAAGMPNTPMIVNEIGWYTQGAPGFLLASEQQRARRIATVAKQFWRTDCNLEGFAPYSWITLERDPQNSEHWFGLADAVTGAPNAGGFAYGRQIRRATGEATKAPPKARLRVCGKKTHRDGKRRPRTNARR